MKEFAQIILGGGLVALFIERVWGSVKNLSHFCFEMVLTIKTISGVDTEAEGSVRADPTGGEVEVGKQRS